MKWVMPSFLVSIITMVAIALNEKFLWHLDPQQIVASVTVAVNFVAVALVADIAKIKRGEMPNWNSTKLFTTLIALLIIGFSEYIGVELDDESIWWIAGTAAAFITGKGLKDIVQLRTSDPQPTTSTDTGYDNPKAANQSH